MDTTIDGQEKPQPEKRKHSEGQEIINEKFKISKWIYHIGKERYERLIYQRDGDNSIVE
jgi:hypothetical protein